MRELTRGHQELMKIIEKGIPNRLVFENQVRDTYLRYVYQEKYESDVIGEEMKPAELDYRAKQWLGNAISLLVLRGYLGLSLTRKGITKNAKKTIEGS